MINIGVKNNWEFNNNNNFITEEPNVYNVAMEGGKGQGGEQKGGEGEIGREGTGGKGKDHYITSYSKINSVLNTSI